jgi:long-chain acyl-CoA synthetase
MHEFEVPASYTVPADASAVASVFTYAQQTPGLVVFQVPKPGSSTAWVDVTAGEFAAAVTAVAKGLIASGVEFGDRVAILSATRYEWTLLDYAIWAAGGCTVAIYDSSSAEQAKWILEDSQTRLLIAENTRHRATIAEIEDALPRLDETLVIENDAIAELTRRGAEIGDDAVHERRNRINAASPATLIYTSGTTGKPKGVMLTHANIYAESVAARLAMRDKIAPGKRTLLFLPLAHIFARVIAIAAFDAKAIVAHTSDWSTLVEQFGAFQPDFILSVPRVFEKVYNGAKQKAHDEGKGAIFDAAARTAVAWSEAVQAGGPNLLLQLKHAVFDVLVYRKLRAALGGRCDSAVSGGGPLGPRLGHFFRGVGVPVYEGYGLTETTAAITVNTPDHVKVGTVGRPLEGHAAKIAEDGELLVRGPVVFGGYWNNPEATADAFVDGWFKTGDLGAIDSDGFVTITGRKKELIVTAGGKNVSPAVLEDSLRANALISQVMVVGDGKPFIAALVTLDQEALPGWKERHNLPADYPMEKLIVHPELVADIDAAVAETNKKVSRAEAIKKVSILPVDWTQETGELTPKMSLKRAVVMKNHAADVERIYA